MLDGKRLLTLTSHNRHLFDGILIISMVLSFDFFMVLGLWDPQQKVLVATRIPDRSGATMIPLIKYWCCPGIEIHTDAWSGYNSLADEVFRHLVVVHR